METANKKPWLSPHGQTLEIAQWVVETKTPLLDTDEYRNHTTMRMWIEESQKILNYTSGSGVPLKKKQVKV